MTQRSPLTHWGREDWCNLADRLVTTAMSHATPGHGRIVMPGEPGGLGPDIDGLEELASWWAGGVAAGVDSGTNVLSQAGARGPRIAGCDHLNIGRPLSRPVHWP